MKRKLNVESGIPSKRRKTDNLLTSAHEKDKQQPQPEKPKNKENNDKRNRKGNGKNYSNVKKNPERRMTKKDKTRLRN